MNPGKARDNFFGNRIVYKLNKKVFITEKHIYKKRCLMKKKGNDEGQGEVYHYSRTRGWMLDNWLRRLFQNPKKIVGPYVKPGMTAIDIGCGPGMFTLAMAGMVGDTGKVIAVDIQQEMLDVVKTKSMQQNLSARIRFHKSEPDSLGIAEKADFILSFYMVHEVPDRDAFLREVRGLLKPGGKYLVVEPANHVSEEAFGSTVAITQGIGFKPVSYPKIALSRAALFTLT